MRPTLARLTFAVGLAWLPASGIAQTADGFFAGKQITMLIASAAGGGYDTYARVFGRHFSAHLPGQPSVIPKNMPGAGGLTAGSTLYNTAPKDGLTIAALTNGIAMDPLFGNPGATFDPLKLNWLGSIGKLQNICATWHTSPVMTIEEARHRPIFVAAAGATSNTTIVPKILNALLGTQFKIVGGYDEGSGMTMALESGEAEGICGLAWSTIKASRPTWIRDKKLNVLVQMDLTRLTELPEVPSALDLVRDADDKKVLELILVRQEMGRPLAAPPGVPADRIALLRHAFDATVADPEFRAEAAQMQMDIDPLPGAAIDDLLARAYAAPKPVIERAAELAEPNRRKPGAN